VAGDDEEMQQFVPIEVLFKGRHFDGQIIILCVAWYTSFKLSLRDLVIMMADRGISVTHTTILRTRLSTDGIVFCRQSDSRTEAGLAKVKRKLNEAQNTIDKAETRTRVIRNWTCQCVLRHQYASVLRPIHHPIVQMGNPNNTQEGAHDGQERASFHSRPSEN
jgi:transposase-like protein